jgi:hypothetical protein
MFGCLANLANVRWGLISGVQGGEVTILEPIGRGAHWKGVPREAGHDRLLLALKGNLRGLSRGARRASCRHAVSHGCYEPRGQGPLGRGIVTMTVTMGRPAKISYLSRLCGDLSGTAVMAGRSWNERTHARRLRRFLTLSFLAHAASPCASLAVSTSRLLACPYEATSGRLPL